MSDRQYNYLKISMKNIIYNKTLLILLILFEHLPILSQTVGTSFKLFDYESRGSRDNYLNYINFFYYFRKLVECNGDKCHYTYPSSIITAAGVLLLLFFILFLIFTQVQSNTKKFGTLTKFLSAVYTNFYDLLFFRCLGLFYFEIFINLFFFVLYLEGSLEKYFLICLLFCYILFSYLTFLHYLIHINIWIKLQNSKIGNYPFDKQFSMVYDIFLLNMKILITVEANLTTYNFNLVDLKLLFFNVIIVIGVLIPNLRIIFHLFQSRTIYLYNRKLNKVRLFFIVLNVLLVISGIFFGSAPLIIWIILYITLFLSGVVVTLYYERKMTENILDSEDVIVKILFLLNENWEESYQMKMTLSKMYVSHQCRCQNNCYLCSQISKSSLSKTVQSLTKTLNEEEIRIINDYDGSSQDLDIKPVHYICLLYKLFKIERKKKTSKTYYDSFYYDIIKVAIYFIQREKNLFKLYLTFNKLLKKYNKVNSSSVLTLRIILDILTAENEEMTQRYEDVINAQKIIHSIRNYIESLQHFIIYVDKIPSAFVKAAAELYKLKGISKSIIFHGNTSQNEYDLILIRFILENIFNHSIKDLNSSFDIQMFDEFLGNHYRNDKILIIKYNIDNDSMALVKTGRNLLGYIGQQFDSLFPYELRKEAGTLFRNKIRKNKFDDHENCFEFIINDEDGYITSFKMKYCILPSVENKEMLICGEYRMKYEDVMYFEINDDRIGIREYLINFSKGLEKIFELNPTWVWLLAQQQKRFNFTDIFTKIDGLHFTNLGTKEIVTSIYILKYKNYIDYYKNSIQHLKDDVSYIELCSRLESIEGKRRNKIKIKFNLRKFITVDSIGRKKYNVYCVSEESNQARQASSYDNDIITPFTKYFETNIGPQQGALLDFHSQSSMAGSHSVSSRDGTTMGSYGKKMRNKSKHITLKERKTFSRFRLLIVASNVFLILISFVFLIIELKLNEKFSSMLQLFSEFRALNRIFTHANLSLFSNICVATKDGKECVNNYNKYIQLMKNSYPNFPDHIPDYIQEELVHKVSELDENFSKLKLHIFTLNDQDISELLKLNTKVVYMQNMNNKLITKTNTLTLQDAIGIFINGLHMIIDEKSYVDQPIHIISVDQDEIDLINVKNPNLTQTQIGIYENLLNYITFRGKFHYSLDLIEEKFILNNKENQNIVIIFTLCLIMFHLILMCLCLWFLRIFQRILQMYISNMHDKLNSDKFIEYFSSKLSSLLVLCNLYQDDPNFKISQILNEKKAYKSVKRSQDSTIIVNGPVDLLTMEKKNKDKPKGRHMKDKYYKEIAFPYLKALVVLFFIYFVYIMSYYMILQGQLNKLNILINYLVANERIDSRIYSKLALPFVMQMTNQTEEMVAQRMNTTGFFVRNNMALVTNSYNEISQLILENPDMLISLENSMKMDCKTNFYEFNDIFLTKTNLTTPYDCYEVLSNVCLSYPIVSTKEERLIANEMMFMIKKNLNSMKRADYDYLFELSTNFIGYEMYTYDLLIIRPYRTYLNNYIITKISNATVLEYTIVIITYLIINILVEVLIFIIINLFIIKRTIIINKNLTNFITCLKE